MTEVELEALGAKLREYFDRPVAEQAAKSLADGSEIELRIQTPDGRGLDAYTFTRKNKKNEILRQGAADPQVVFTLTPAAVEAIVSDPSDDVGQIGVNIAKLIVSQDSERRVRVQLKAGFMTLFTKGYLGVITAGGASLASFLASRGLGGLDALKSAMKKMRE